MWSKLVSRLLVGAGIVIALVLAWGLWLAAEMGEFRQVQNLHPGECVAVPGMPGGEDITIHPRGHLAYISSDDRRSVMRGEPIPGAIFSYALDEPQARPVNLTPQAGVDFRPHGIDLFVGEDGQEVLFVVNHPGESLFGAPEGQTGPAHTVEIFDIEGGELVHRRTVSGPLMISPNDVVAVDAERFYFTNDHGTRPGWRRELEDYLRLPWASVVYFDGEELVEVLDGLTFANGINMSADGRRVYVAETTRGTLREYIRDADSGALEHRRTLDMGFGVDNIEVDADGDLWIGGHVKLLTFVRYVDNPEVLAPSQVVRVRLDEGDYRVETEFMDDGALLSGASVGAWHDGRLLIGSVFEDHIIDCRSETEIAAGE